MPRQFVCALQPHARRASKTHTASDTLRFTGFDDKIIAMYVRAESLSRDEHVQELPSAVLAESTDTMSTRTDTISRIYELQ